MLRAGCFVPLRGKPATRLQGIGDTHGARCFARAGVWGAHAWFEPCGALCFTLTGTLPAQWMWGMHRMPGPVHPTQAWRNLLGCWALLPVCATFL